MLDQYYVFIHVVYLGIPLVREVGGETLLYGTVRHSEEEIEVLTSQRNV